MATQTIETEVEVPICKTQICKKPLTWMKHGQCWRCLRCNPIQKSVPTEVPASKRIDVKPDINKVQDMIDASMSEERIREIVQDELTNWHLQKPSVMKEDVDELIEKTTFTNNTPVEIPDEVARLTPTNNIHIEPEIVEETWRQKAKRLGVKTHKDNAGGMRKKIDVLAEVEAVETKGSAIE